MISFDKFLNKTVEVEFGGRIVHVRMPSANVMRKFSLIEMEYDKEKTDAFNIKKRSALELLNNNEEGEVFEESELELIPICGLDVFVKTVLTEAEELRKNPNSDSQSQKAK